MKGIGNLKIDLKMVLKGDLTNLIRHLKRYLAPDLQQVFQMKKGFKEHCEMSLGRAIKTERERLTSSSI